MATLEAKGRNLGSYCPGNWCRWNAQIEKKESAWFWPLNWKSEWQTLTLKLHSLIKVSLFLPYYGHLKWFCWKYCSLGATKSCDAFDVQTTVTSQMHFSFMWWKILAKRDSNPYKSKTYKNCCLCLSNAKLKCWNILPRFM